jgi:serine/threonine protein kinase
MLVNPEAVAAALGSNYALGPEIGSGGQGIVMAATQKKLGRLVAVKVVPGDPITDQRETFLDESRHLAKLDHPNVVRVYDTKEYDTGSGHLYLIIMEWLPKTFGQLMAFPPTNQQVCALIAQAAQGLREAYDRSRLLHLDIKPSNLMVTAQGVAKVVDFGVAKIVERSSITGSAIGSPLYMAPEQWNGKGVNRATDVYALGLVFYYMLAKRPPFDPNLGIGELYHYHCEVMPPPFEPHMVPETLAQLVMRMLSKEREKRFQTWDEFLEELRNVANREFKPGWQDPGLDVNQLQEGSDLWPNPKLADEPYILGNPPPTRPVTAPPPTVAYTEPNQPRPADPIAPPPSVLPAADGSAPPPADSPAPPVPAPSPQTPIPAAATPAAAAAFGPTQTPSPAWPPPWSPQPGRSGPLPVTTSAVRRRRHRISVLAVILPVLALLAGVLFMQGLPHFGTSPPAPTASVPSHGGPGHAQAPNHGSTPQPAAVRTCRQIPPTPQHSQGITLPQPGGSTESRQALQDVQAAHYDTAVNLDSADTSATGLSTIQQWVNDANCDGLNAIVSVDNVFNLQGISQGQSYVQSLQNNVKAFALWMNHATPNGAGNDPVGTINQRVAEIRQVTKKPVWCFIDRLSAEDTMAYKCDVRVPVYLPYKGSSYYGSDNLYQEVGATAYAVDRLHSVAGLQGMSWWGDEPQDAARLGFPKSINGQPVGDPPKSVVQSYARMLLGAGDRSVVVITQGNSANNLPYLASLGNALHPLLAG